MMVNNFYLVMSTFSAFFFWFIIVFKKMFLFGFQALTIVFVFMALYCAQAEAKWNRPLPNNPLYYRCLFECQVCYDMYGRHFDSHRCGEKCVFSAGKSIDIGCNNPEYHRRIPADSPTLHLKVPEGL